MKNKYTQKDYKTPYTTETNGFEMQVDYKDAFTGVYHSKMKDSKIVIYQKMEKQFGLAKV